MTKSQVQQFIVLIVLVLVLASQALAQSPGESVDAALDDLRAVDGALLADHNADNAAQTEVLGDIVGQQLMIDAGQNNEINKLSGALDALGVRIDALETLASPVEPLPPTPDPVPVPTPTPTPTPAGAGAQWQFGVGPMAYWAGADPLINLLQVNAGESEWSADVFDHETQSFHKVLGHIGLIRSGAKVNPGFYAGDYIIDWQGEGRVGIGLINGRQTREGPNRVRERFDGKTRGWGGVQIQSIDNPAVGISNIRVYRAEHEAALKAGKIFNPAFVNSIARYDIVRTMDWNLGRRVTRVDQIPGMDAQYWSASGVPLEAQFKLAQEAGVALWVNAPERLGAPDGLNARLSEMPNQRQRWALIAEQFDAVAGSAEWDAYAQALVAAMEATGYPLDRHFYLELANETWNWGGPFGYATEWYFALTQKLAERTGTKYAANPVRGAYGYFSGQLAEAFARALDAAGRSEQQWTLVIGTQTAWDAHTVSALQGVRDYSGARPSAAVGDDFMQPMARFGVAATGYYGGAFSDVGNGLFGADVRRAAWRAEWLRRLDADPEALAQYLRDFMAGPAPRKLNVAWVVAQSRKHQRAAERFGARYIGQYEGSSHDTLDAELSQNPKALAFYKAWQTGPHHAALIRLHAKKMREAFPDAILSNYQHWSDGGVPPNAPWIFNTQWGEETEAEKALFEMVGE